MYNIHLLPATFGDAILIEYGTKAAPHYILIDGGPYYVFDEVFEAIRRIAPAMEALELLVVTHIDIDHIDGTVKMLNQSNLPFQIKEIWFNGREQLMEAANSDILGSLQGEYLTDLIADKKLPHNQCVKGKPICITDYNKLPVILLPGGMEITLLSPGRQALVDLIPVWDEELKDKNVESEWETDTRYADDLLGETELDVEALQLTEAKGDKSAANCSSIAFIAAYKGKRCLFAADAPSDALLAAINPMLEASGEERLQVDAWKLAHHGSKKSTQDHVMEKIDCKTMLISSDGKRYRHPDTPVIAKLISNNGPDLSFYFNYRTAFNEMWDNENLKEQYRYEVVYPEDNNQPGISIAL